MEDLQSLLHRDYGLRSQGKSAPMGGTIPPSYNPNPSQNNHMSSSSMNELFTDDHVGVLGAGSAAKEVPRSGFGMSSPIVGYDDIFKDLSVAGPKPSSIVPVYDALVYGDDTFGSVRGVRSSSSIVSYDKVHITVAIVELWLMCHSPTVRSQALRNLMWSDVTYDAWSHAAKMLDLLTPRHNETELYDKDLVRNKLRELIHRQQEGGIRDTIFFLCVILMQNLGNMCNPRLHQGRLQVDVFIRAVQKQMQSGRRCFFSRWSVAQ